MPNRPFGKAVIAPRKDSLVELFGLQGALFFDNDDPFSKVLVNVLDLEHMGKHNREIISQYDWSKIGSYLKAIYEEVLKN